MTYYEWLDAQKQKEKLAQATKTPQTGYYDWLAQQGIGADDDIAPVRKQVSSAGDVIDAMKDGFSRWKNRQKSKNEDNGTWFNKGAYDDGYQFGDWTKSLDATRKDVEIGFLQGMGNFVEGITDFILHGTAYVGDALGADDFADSVHGLANKNTVDSAANWMRKNGWGGGTEDSFLGEKSQGVTQGLGQVATTILTAGAGEAIGLGAKGISALTTGSMFASSTGSGIGEAYKGGATDKEALTYGLMSGATEAGSELLFGGLGKSVNALGISRGISSLDDIFAKKLSSKVGNQVAKNLIQYGVKSSAEGFEEVVAGLGSAVAKKLTYMSDEELKKLVADEDLLDQFVTGTIVSGIAQGGDFIKSNKTGKDFVGGLTKNEEAVINKVFDDEVAKRGKLTSREKSKLYYDILRRMDRGGIDTDTIESVLGGDSYKAYKDTIDSEKSLVEQEKSLTNEYNALNKKMWRDMTGEEMDRREELKTLLPELRAKIKANESGENRNQLKSKLSQDVFSMVKNDRLVESYNEQVRATQDFKADFAKFKGAKHEDAAKKTLENAMKAGASNTNAVHDIVDLAAHISAESGKVFEFKSNEDIKNDFIARQTKLIAEFEALENPTAEQVKYLAEMKDQLEKVKSGKVIVNGDITGDGIVLNIDSDKPLNRITGHEITHSLEKAKAYTELRDTLFAYAKSKGVDIDAKLAELNRKYAGVKDANAESELVADLVGDYLFTDYDYVNSLATGNRNLAQRIYDEIKHLCKMATAGSKEARQLEQVKYNFEKAFREAEQAQKNTADSGVKYALSKDVNGNVFVDVTEDIFDPNNGESVARTIQRVISEKFNNLIETNGQKFQINKTTNDEFRRSESATKLMESSPVAYNDKLKAIANADEILTAAKNWIGEEAKHNRKDDIVEFGRGNVMYRVGKNGYVADVLVGIRKNGAAVLYDLVNIYETNIAEAPVTMASNDNSQRRQGASANDKLPQNGKVVKTQFSLSDSDGKALSKEQQEYFKDSKAVDEKGNLQVVYHGSKNSGFNTFRYDKNVQTGTDYGEAYYFTSDRQKASGYSYDVTKDERVSQYQKDREDLKKRFLETHSAEDRDAFLNYTLNGKKLHELIDDEGYLTEGGEVKEVYLNLTNPLIVDAGGKYYYEVYPEYFDKAKAEGHDGIIVKNVIDNPRGEARPIDTYIAFRQNQIKSTTNENPTADADIRYSLSDSSNKKLYTGSPVTDITQFKVGGANGAKQTGDRYGRGIYLTTNKSTAQGYAGDSGRVYEINADGLNIFNLNDSITEEMKATLRRELNGKDKQFRNSVLRNFRLEKTFSDFKSAERFFDEQRKIWKEEDGYYSANKPEILSADDKTGKAVIEYTDFVNIDNAIGNLDGNQLYDALKSISTDDFASFITGHGFDGIAFDEDADNQQYVIYRNEDRLNILPENKADPDIHYSLSDSDYLDAVNRGDTETAQKMVDEAANFAMRDSKIRDKNGDLIPVYHGTKEMFYVFDTSINGAKNGTAEGFGIYLSDNQEVTRSYGDRQIKMYANITKPATSFKKTISQNTLVKLIKDTCEKEAQRMVADGEYDSFEDAIKDTWISNYVYTYDISTNQAYREVAQNFLRQNSNDMAIVQEVMFGMAIRDYPSATRFYQESLTPITGIDGFITKWEDSNTGEASTIYLAFDSSQLKYADPVTKDDNGNVIPLSQRFNKANDDIRYSLSDSDGKTLSKEQQSFFKDSKARDENGNLLVMYHGSQSLGFTVFDPNASDDNKSFFFSDKPSVAASYSNTEDEIAPYDGEKTSGLYKTYLNLKNPYIVDARGSKWNNVVEFTEGDEFLSDIGAYMGIIRTMDSSLTIEDFLDSVRGDLVGSTDYAIDELFIDEDTEESHFTPQEQKDLRELAERINNAYLEWDEDAHIDEDGESTDFESYVRQNYTHKTTRQIANEAYKNGYDGVIFKNIVDVGKFGNMAQQNYDKSTVAVAFNSNQIKSVDNQTPTEDPDIRHSLSYEDEDIAPVGGYDFYGKDFRKAADTVAETEVPVTETVAPVNTGVTAEDEAPVDEATKRKEVESVVGNRDGFVSKKAMSLYEEVKGMKKGVRVSKELSYLLDTLDLSEEAKSDSYRSLRTALLNIRDNPNQVVNPKSAIESRVREMIGREYESMVEDFMFADGVTESIYKKMQGLHTELENDRTLREQSIADFDSEIARLQAVYDSKKNQNSKLANDLLLRIERIKRLKTQVVDKYDRRIETLEARLEKMSQPGYKTAMQRKAKQAEYTSLMEELVGDTSTWVDKKLGLSYKVNTLRRNLRDIVRDANGKQDIAKADAIYDELQGKYNHNEAELKRESMRIKKVFQEMKLNHAEDIYAHMLGEFRHNPDTKLTEDNVKEFYEKHKNKIDTAKVDKAIEESRKVFDELIVRLNERLREQGMKEIPYRQGYFPHFTNPKQKWYHKAFNWKPVDNEIPTSIAGLTEEFNPERSWQSFNKERKGDTTDYSLEQGLDSYIHGALDWIYHIEDIQKRRALENHIRYVHSDEGIKKRIEEIRNNESYDADEAQALIDAVYAEAKNPLNNFVTDLRAGTNTLANKKSSMDRKTEELTNRKIYSVMTNLNNRITANMVVGSFSSALTNFIPITQSWMEVSPVYSLKGMRDTIISTIRDDGIVNKSDFLTNRLMNEEKLFQTGWDKVSDKAAIMMEAIDSFTSQTVWRSKYLQNISEGMSETEAIKNADQFAENVIAGRSRGNQPTIFDAKNPLTKIFTAFQLEVNNQYGYLFKDAPQDSKNKARLVKGYATAFLGAYAYNALYSSLVGRDAAFDPISILEDLFKDLFGDDDEEPDEIINNFVGNVLEEVPFVGGLMGGGRIPLSSAIPYEGDYKTFITDIANGELSAKEMLKPLYYLGLPVGGGQIKKTNEGLGMFLSDHPVSGSYTESGNLRFPVENTPGNVLQAALFGQYASQNARDYFDNGRSPLKEKQIQEYMDVDIPIRDYWEYREGLAKQKTTEGKLDYISGLDLPVAKKNILANNATDRKDPINMENYGNFSSLDEFDFATNNPGKYAVSQVVGDYSTYSKYYEDINDLTADKDENGKSITGSRKEKVFDYINSLPLDYGQKCILFKSQYKADDSMNLDIIEYLNSREDIPYEEMVTILTELGFTVKGNNVYWD